MKQYFILLQFIILIASCTSIPKKADYLGKWIYTGNEQSNHYSIMKNDTLMIEEYKTGLTVIPLNYKFEIDSSSLYYYDKNEGSIYNKRFSSKLFYNAHTKEIQDCTAIISERRFPLPNGFETTNTINFKRIK